MAPEAPGNLVVVDLLRFQNTELVGYVEHVEYSLEQTSQIEGTGDWFYVLWNETPKGEGYIPVGGGVVYVKYPPGYEKTPKSHIKLDVLSGDRYSYRHLALGEGCMFVLILPEDYTIANPQPMLRSAKVFKKKRLAVYWKPAQKYGAEIKITWQLKKFDGDLSSERNRINDDIDRSENVPDNIGVIVEDPKPQIESKSANIRL